MGTRGASGGQAAEATARRLVDEFAALGPIESRQMFGGHGVFCESVMFALVDPQGAAFLRVGEEAKQFEDLGGHKHGRMPYWSVPAEVLDDRDELIRWAADALAVARANKKKG